MNTISQLMAEMADAGASLEHIRIAVRYLEAERTKDADRRAASAFRTAKRRKLMPTDWEELRFSVFSRDAFTCVYCGAADVALHCDHVIPLSRGGSNDMRNLATACEACNTSKGARTPSEWRRA